MKLVWSAQAVEDLPALRAFIETDDPAAARRTALRVIEAIETLIPANPHVGGQDACPGRASASSRGRLKLRLIACATERSKPCAFFTARGAGLIGYETGWRELARRRG